MVGLAQGLTIVEILFDLCDMTRDAQGWTNHSDENANVQNLCQASDTRARAPAKLCYYGMVNIYR